MDDRISALEKQCADLQSQIYGGQVKYNALRAVITYVLPGVLNANGFIPEDMHRYKDVATAAVLNSTMPGATPKLSDDVTQGISDEIEALYTNLAEGIVISKAGRAAVADSKPPRDTGDPLVEMIAALKLDLPESQYGILAFVIRREVAAAIEGETAAMLSLCDRESRWTADSPTAKLVLQRVVNFARSRTLPPRPSFFDGFFEKSKDE